MTIRERLAKSAHLAAFGAVAWEKADEAWAAGDHLECARLSLDAVMMENKAAALLGITLPELQAISKQIIDEEKTREGPPPLPPGGWA